MSQHTPGPWTLGGTGNGYQYHIWPLDESGTLRRKIATVCHEDGPDPGAARTLYHDTEAESNARLIAAAPEMYEALRQVMAWSDDLMSRRRFRLANVQLGLEMVRAKVRMALRRANREEE